MKQVLEYPKKIRWRNHSQGTTDDKEYPEMSEDFKNTVEEQGNIEAHEMFMITDAIQCQTCHHYATLDTHVARVDLILLTTSAFVFETWKTTGKTTGNSEASLNSITKRVTISRVPRKSKTSILDRYQEDDRYHVHLHRRKRKNMGPYCERTKKRTRPL